MWMLSHKVGLPSLLGLFLTNTGAARPLLPSPPVALIARLAHAFSKVRSFVRAACLAALKSQAGCPGRAALTTRQPSLKFGLQIADCELRIGSLWKVSPPVPPNSGVW